MTPSHKQVAKPSEEQMKMAREINFPVCNCDEDCGCPSYEEVITSVATAISKAVEDAVKDYCKRTVEAYDNGRIDEREACAKVAEYWIGTEASPETITKAIRARSKKEVKNG